MRKSRMSLMLAMAALAMVCQNGATDASKAKMSPDIVELTSSNYDEATAGGKNVFIMFHVFWCSHCQELIPNWNKLASKYKNSTAPLQFLHVDCGEENERDGLCKKHRIQGTPSILYGEPGHHGAYLQQYPGDFEYHSISSFAKEHLETPICSPANLDACEETMQQRIAQWQAQSYTELKDGINQVQLQLDQIDVESKDAYKLLKATYDDMQRHKVMSDARIKDTIRIMKEVLDSK